MFLNIQQSIEELLAYGRSKGLLEEGDVEFARNQLLYELGLDEADSELAVGSGSQTAAELLKPILNWAVLNEKIEQDTTLFRDLFDTKLMGHLTPWPSVVTDRFYKRYQEQGPSVATKEFYQLAQDTHYIRMDRVALNESWASHESYGELEITINLSKPELDPKDIEKAKQSVASSYPDGLLHPENVGYAGRVNHPARQNLRQVPVELGEEKWLLQFSPYVYYHQHAIVLSKEKRPMQITKSTFSRLLEFVDKFPHYFIGSNADLPIVGGSILSHDHYQAGQHEFPMARAGSRWSFTLKGAPDVEASLLDWPMTVIRLRGKNRAHLEDAGASVLHEWRNYSDEQTAIYSSTDEELHNTITPIARFREGLFELDLVLRNNRTTDEHPFGLFHPHLEVHPIKKENIGLIEVMGLAILPGRLKNELLELAEALTQDKRENDWNVDEKLTKHLGWVKQMDSTLFSSSPQENLQHLKEEVGHIFSTALSHCGVFKQDEEAGLQAFQRFISKVNEN
ncbi:UDP-glucose--hexose-1-phosphate uridylyltransferase [Alkalicoccobacillus porphyridii]|uniref:Galactose-1-phosphate uridylyltransferase n=1 Tax=Alkalicoccobacillus porphyridii TaxID=2597270 RepID=A0A554A448_9BACI|nr:UDP-glucose--hexose-1-phosphate uridylyltransferase [Alkalicoccobacillus porphyridii]TSB48469.1 UDP-glucose--hexose-1-phosphate uridylyltransferase [Alkalicoccobacillus porphyridii]